MLLHSPHNLRPLTWLRFIDDIFMLWTHGPTSLTNFLSYINSFHPTIKLTHQQSHTSINFLDTTIILTPQHTLHSTLYTKPTDKGLLLHHSSHHPNACKRGVIYSQALRYRRIITNDHDLHIHLLRLHKILLTRGYSHSTILSAFRQATSHTQHQLLQPKAPLINNGIHLPFVIPFNTDLPHITRILRQHWHLINTDPTLSHLFPHPPFLSHSRHRNLKDMLVHSNFYKHHNHLSPNTTTPDSSITSNPH